MKIKGLLAVATLIGAFVSPANAVTVNYDITFDFTNTGVADVVGHLAINSPPASFPGTYSGAGLANVISSFSVTFQNPTDTFSCTGNGCIYGLPVPGGFTSLSFNAAGALTAIGALFSKSTNQNNLLTLEIGATGTFTGTGLAFRWNPPGQGNDNREAGITITRAEVSASPVPGPIVGAGLPGLLVALSGLAILARCRRKQVGIA
jgi:hypothetical protein